MRRIVVAAAALVALAACSQSDTREAPPAVQTAGAASAETAAPLDLPAGAYTLDESHASLLFRVNHLGFSQYTSRFETWDADLTLDPANPAAASVTATVDAKSLQVENPPPGFEDELRGPDWLDTGAHPEITFRSTRVEPTGPRAAKITGDFTLHGVTRPVTLDATFNGGYRGHPMDPNARIGFSAKGTLNRSEFGIAAGIPAPGTTMGVSDAVDVIIEAEFTGPPLAQAPAAG